MIIECLPKSVFNKNMQDFSKCEGEWKVHDKIDEEFVRQSFLLMQQVTRESEPKKNAEDYGWMNIKEQLMNGRVVSDPFMLYRMKSNLSHCPLCGGSYDEKNHDYAVSRRDNKTKICSQCGMKEAFDDYFDRRE